MLSTRRNPRKACDALQYNPRRLEIRRRFPTTARCEPNRQPHHAASEQASIRYNTFVQRQRRITPSQRAQAYLSEPTMLARGQRMHKSESRGATANRRGGRAHESTSTLETKGEPTHAHAPQRDAQIESCPEGNHSILQQKRRPTRQLQTQRRRLLSSVDQTTQHHNAQLREPRSSKPRLAKPRRNHAGCVPVRAPNAWRVKPRSPPVGRQHCSPHF